MRIARCVCAQSGREEDNGILASGDIALHSVAYHLTSASDWVRLATFQKKKKGADLTMGSKVCLDKIPYILKLQVFRDKLQPQNVG